MVIRRSKVILHTYLEFEHQHKDINGLLNSCSIQFLLSNKFLAPLPGRATVFIEFLELKRIVSSLLQVTGWRNRKTRLAVTYKWSWASALKSRDQVPSELSRFLGSGYGSAARKISLLTICFAELLALQKYSLLQIYFLYAIHQEPANKTIVKHLLKSLKID